MKYTADERLEIGRRMYNREITYRDAMELYGISETCAHKYMTDYKRKQGIPVKNSSPCKSGLSSQSLRVRSISSASPDIEEYMSMSKEELINQLIIAKANEARAKKGYEVKGIGANKEYISLNNRNTKS